MLLNHLILDYIEIQSIESYKNTNKILIILRSSLSFVNKSLIISMFPFSIAAYNAVL